MLRLEWTTPAADQFERNQDHYQALNPRAAQMLAQRVRTSIEQLRAMPNAGRPGLRVGTRECVVPRTPYIVVYRTRGDVLEILHVFHERQDWTHVEE